VFCDEVLDALEEIAAGELTPDGRIAAHLSTCANCAAALADAREIERLLRARPVPRASSQFTAQTMARVRRARWRSEQFLDAGFNLTLGIIVTAIVAGVFMLLRLTGLTSVGDDALSIFRSAFVALLERAAPALPIYVGASLLLAAAIGFWWWAERGTAP
jgi:anti-sigma factor RsiW